MILCQQYIYIVESQ